MKHKQKNKILNLRHYRPDANESVMLLEALENAVSKTLAYTKKNQTPQLGLAMLPNRGAEGAKHFVQYSYMMVQTYTPELLTNAVTQIIESDIKNLSEFDLIDAYNGLTAQLKSLVSDLQLITDSVTVMYRSVPVHYRVGYLFRDTNAKTTKSQLQALINALSMMITTIESSYSVKSN